MIEIIREDHWNRAAEKRSLPKNVKQIGTPDAGDRIYIENDAYQKMHTYEKNVERMVYVLMGHFDNFCGCDCTFVEDAVEVREIDFQGNLPVWTDESWKYLYRRLRPEHEDMVIVGWAIDICGQMPGMSAQLEHIHQNYFGGKQQVLLLLDSLEHEEVFFGNRNGYLKRKMGFYICYNKMFHTEEWFAPHKVSDGNAETVSYNMNEEELRRQESYRAYLNQRREEGRSSYERPPHRSSFGMTFLLVLVIAALGYSTFINQQKTNEMEQVLAQITQTGTWQGREEDVVRVEEIVGSIVRDTTTESSQNTELPTETMQSMWVSNETETMQPDTAAVQEQTQVMMPLSEAENYLKQGYYIVQPGDNLAGICQKLYRSTAVMDELCRINQIDNPDAIYAGQYLELP